jgi:hypothetical protein
LPRLVKREKDYKQFTIFYQELCLIVVDLQKKVHKLLKNNTELTIQNQKLDITIEELIKLNIELELKLNESKQQREVIYLQIKFIPRNLNLTGNQRARAK